MHQFQRQQGHLFYVLSQMSQWNFKKVVWSKLFLCSFAHNSLSKRRLLLSQYTGKRAPLHGEIVQSWLQIKARQAADTNIWDASLPCNLNFQQQSNLVSSENCRKRKRFFIRLLHGFRTTNRKLTGVLDLLWAYCPLYQHKNMAALQLHSFFNQTIVAWLSLAFLLLRYALLNTSGMTARDVISTFCAIKLISIQTPIYVQVKIYQLTWYLADMLPYPFQVHATQFYNHWIKTLFLVNLFTRMLL